VERNASGHRVHVPILAVEVESVERRGIPKPMRCPKSVTPRKLEANRKNAKRSTGPRTQRGKRDTRFNAVTLGLFAKHVVIPICDGYKPEKDFSSLLEGVHEEFQPVGLYEEWLVVKIAEYMWRLRRATRCESGSVRESAIWARREESMMLRSGGRDDNQRTLDLAIELGNLDEAQKQLRDSGALSQRIYEKVAPIVENKKQTAVRVENDEKSVETGFDRELFLTCIAGRKELLELNYKSLCHIEGQRSDARFDFDCFPPEEHMDRILRYEDRMHRQIDWAVQRLFESQERRKTIQSCSGENEKRSQ
jgi:hypothetical protein